MAITIRLPPNLHERVARVAKEQGISINALIAISVEPYLQQHAQKKKLTTDYLNRTALEEAIWRKDLSDRHAIRDDL